MEGRFAELQDRVDFVVKQTADGQKALTDDVLRKFEQRLQDCTRAAEAAGAAEKQVRLGGAGRGAGRAGSRASGWQDVCAYCRRLGRAAFAGLGCTAFQPSLNVLLHTASSRALQALLVRISALEDKLLGADNVGGHLAAVSDIAGILGLSIPPVRAGCQLAAGGANWMCNVACLLALRSLWHRQHIDDGCGHSPALPAAVSHQQPEERWSSRRCGMGR